MQVKRGFTLVEILIVVVILGILAAIVVPQFTQASTEAKLNSLCSNLQSLRSQIELYKVQHNDVAPGNDIDASTGAVTANVANFAPQMVFCTDINGRQQRHQRAGYRHLRVRTVPGENSGQPVQQLPIRLAVAAADGVGWVYNPDTGEIHAGPDSTADSNDHQSR